MKKKCPKCGKEDMRVWGLVLKDGMFLQCKSCGWTSNNMAWTKKAKEEWESLNAKQKEREGNNAG